ncbi:hypothetical protein CHLRE_02g141266v5 [Chlamydomonas reinhardtii]|uniref:Uncharacterized protein n=1 Tax=Chlamydomonas reinhardtii TaxID=3055 RepID=A0A2K3E489_CHLRE|nr:uncharacterized protein CHLRE_02g141266v5 [Chlamydomonas reinhardtii]PNW87591.1 hypothetical protein CHLRE_02g141266v5 [Chlamydomonas reinhardtii]
MSAAGSPGEQRPVVCFGIDAGTMTTLVGIVKVVDGNASDVEFLVDGAVEGPARRRVGRKGLFLALEWNSF